MLLYKGLLIHNLGLKGRISAIEEMVDGSLDFDDATSVAAMRRLGVESIVSFDQNFDGVKRISRVEPEKALVLK